MIRTSLQVALHHLADGSTLPEDVIPFGCALTSWRATVVRCRICGASWYGIVDVEADDAALLCSSCGPGAVVVAERLGGLGGSWHLVVAPEPMRREATFL